MAFSGCVAPPPGLESAASVKTAGHREDFGFWAPPGLETATMAKAEAVPASGFWANAVTEVAPHLNAEGLRRAVAVVDRALRNAQHIKALDELIGGVDEEERPTTPYLLSAACLRAQVGEEQVQLLGELQRLRLEHGEPMAPAPAARPQPTAPPAAPPTAPPKLPGAGVAVAPPSPASMTPVAETAAKAPAPEQAEAAKSPEKPGRQVQTLSSSLQLLSHEDPDCLLIVRHINKLGFKASRILKRHYSVYGPVVRVLVAHSTVRQSGSDGHARRRPSSLGFLQMASAEAVKAILAAGPEQEVTGAAIRVQKFERLASQEAHENEEDAGLNADVVFERCHSAGSNISLATTSTGVSERSCASNGASSALAAESDYE